MNRPPQSLPIVSSLSISGVTAKHMRFPAADDGPMSVAAIENAYLVTVQLRGATRLQLWRKDEVVFDDVFETGAVAVLDLSRPWRRRHLSGFDSLCFHVPFGTLARAAVGLGLSGMPELIGEIGAIDPVLLSLSLSLLPALDDPAAANRRFLTQVQNAVVSHLLHAYAASDRTTPARGRLSPRQEDLAKDFMRENFSRSISLEETALACGLSRSHFIRAFRNSTGVTPHRWLLDYRIERVTALLAQPITIAEIASLCGFADQSHLSRVFQKNMGITPAAWRRRVGSDHS